MLPLLISTLREDGVSATPEAAGEGCLFCGLSTGSYSDGPRCCALCHLVRHLERPRIDEELDLVWLPELSQAALISIVREIHVRLQVKGLRPDAAAVTGVETPDGNALQFTRAALLARRETAAEHLGIHLPSELAHCLTRMARTAYDRRHRLLGGLRVLPAGRFFVGGTDVYADIVASWRPQETGDAQTSTQGAA